ncbi:N-acetylglucosamine-6-phosphate deacetylase [Deinococcus sp. KSM4-11]|uniref:N-acetylglucosamine-6-phosphate deacetylase n=1 Tax=Deinococcus sp. KSM4-11 TaxID=2568654 RepID=UPI0010A4CF5F|nr:amidohydrolase family protein [Deinococcus sp. KSM4-11]THF85927.1 N-acetylglucosamine-6-phosphate deacetylase [Deinococcus sp. KSM4-11]
MPAPTPTTRLTGQLVLGDQLIPGRIDFTETITTVTPLPAAPADALILPGFIDAHVHGGNGADTMDGPDGIRTLAQFHARHGTTTLLPTTITNAWENVLNALHAVSDVMRGGVDGGPDIPGAHLEGPFISPDRLGAQPPFTVLPTPELIGQVLDIGVVRAVTIAPELPGALDAALALGGAGVRIGIGHTRADAATVTAFLIALHAQGIRTCSTHLFNAMGGIEGRDPGVPGALLADPHAFHEVILDLLHVHPTSFRLARAAAPERVTLVTDAMRAAGLGDGDSELGGQRVIVRGGEARLPGGSLAGSLLTMDMALRNAVTSGVPLPEASRLLSGVPAASLNLTDRGSLKVGQRADVVVLNADFDVESVYVGGRHIPGAGA